MSFNTDLSNEYKQYPLMDIMKFIACFQIVLLHCGPAYWMSAPCRLAVPFFFASSSYLFFAKGANIAKYVKRLSLLFIVWFVLELPLTIIRYQDISVLEFILKLFFGNSFYGSWYIVASIEAVVIVYYLSKKFSNITLLIISIFLYLLCLISSSYYYLMPSEIQIYIETINTYIHLPRSFAYATIFVLIGKIANEKTIRLSWIVTLILLIVWIFEIIAIRPLVFEDYTFVMLPVLTLCILLISTSNAQYFKLLNMGGVSNHKKDVYSYLSNTHAIYIVVCVIF